ncbi:MAG TPA: hypothetical protein VLG40_04875 [Candidatus Saccharimonas sp.]|nr:hypothetical protein [Candidatus Saccharimonas sp.]
MGLGFFSPGSWPNDSTRGMSDQGLLNMSPDDIMMLMRQNMLQLLDAVGKANTKKLAVLGHGEPGIWQDWIRITAGTKLREVLGLQTHSGKTYQEYFGKFDFRNGRRIDPKLVPAMANAMGYAAWAIMGYEVFKEIRKEHDLPHLKFQVGIPHPFDMAQLTGLYIGGDAFIKATAIEMQTILRAIPAQDLVFSIELPVSQVFVAAASMLGLGSVMGSYAANVIGRLLDQIPEQYRRFIQLNLHPCWGDLGHKSVMEAMLLPLHLPSPLKRWLCRKLQGVKNVTRLVRPILKKHGGCNKGGHVWIVQLPLAVGSQQAPTATQAYLPLRALQGFGATFSAGLTHENASSEDVLRALFAAVHAAGKFFFGFVGPRCGLGRCSEAQATAEVEQAVLIGKTIG